VIETVESQQAVRMTSKIGNRRYPHSTALGKILLSDLPEREVLRLIRSKGMPQFTPATIVREKDLIVELERVRTQGYAMDNMENELDGRCIAAPIMNAQRKVIAALSISGPLPRMTSGEFMGSMDLDELQDVEATVRDIQAGTGLAEGDDHCDPACDAGPPNAGRSKDLDDLAEYMENLEFPPNPNLLRDGSLTPGARNGQVLFDTFETVCTGCHVDLIPHIPLKTDAGTGRGPGERKGTEFDSPSLRGTYKTAPYLHDGSAATLMDVLTTQNPDDLHGGTSNLAQDELEALVLYLNSIGTDATEFPLTGVFYINPGLTDAWFDARQSGQGFFIIVFPDREEIFLAWFTYDAERPELSVVALFGAADQRWLTAQGKYSGNRAELKITLSKGGVFNDSDHQVANMDYGTLILEFTGCNSGLVRYEIPSLGLEGLIAIERVARDNIALCEQFERERMLQ